MTKDSWINPWMVILVLFVLKKADFLPNVQISNEVSINRTINVNSFTFMCTSDSPFMGCTVEFLVNRSTIDDLRNANSTCYHKDGVCKPEICSCSDNCKSFTVSVIRSTNMTNHIFGCGGKIENRSVNAFYRVNASVMFDGEYFHQQKTMYDLISDGTTTSKSHQDPKFHILAVIVLSSVFCGIMCFLGV